MSVKRTMVDADTSVGMKSVLTHATVELDIQMNADGRRLRW